jgi:hypothetical protein
MHNGIIDYVPPRYRLLYEIAFELPYRRVCAFIQFDASCVALPLRDCHLCLFLSTRLLTENTDPYNPSS